MIYIFYFGKKARIKGLIPKLHIFGRNYIYNLFSSSNLTCLTSIFSLNWLWPWFHVLFQWISYINLVMVFELILVLKKLVQEEADLSTCRCRIRLHGVVYLIPHANLADPTFLRVTLTTGKLCLTSIVQIAWRLYSIVSYETINEFNFSRKHNMTETVYIYNHWTTGRSFTKKNKMPKMATTTRHSSI
jgi:hypothetical protein